MKVGGLRTVGPSPGPRRYMLQSRRESPSTVPAVYAAKPPGVPSTASRLVLFLSGSLCWDQSSILEIIRLPGNPTRVRTLRGAGRPGRQRTCPLRQLQERALKRHASVLVSVAVTSVTSCPSSTPTFFGRRVSFKRDGGLNGQKIALTAIVDQTNNWPRHAASSRRPSSNAAPL